MNNRRTRTTQQVLIGLALLALPTLAFAGTTVQPGDILQVYKNLETQWASNAASIGAALFGVFAGLEFAWTWITWLLEKGGGDGESVIPTLLKKILQLSFGFWLVKNAASGLDLIGTLIQGFEWLGTHIGGASASSITSTANAGYLTPGGIFNEGITIASDMWQSAYSGITLTNIGHDLGVVFITVPALLLVAAIFAFLSLSLIMTLVETYLVIGAGAVFLAFLGSRWTQQFGEKYISYAVSTGVKLFVFFLVLTAGQQLAATWISAAGSAGTNLINYVGIGLSVLVFGMVAMKTPALASSLISGAGGLLGAAGLIGAAAGVAAATAAAAVTGGVGTAALGKMAAGTSAGQAMLGMGKAGLGKIGDAMAGLGKGGGGESGGSGAPGLGDVAGAGGLGSALADAAGSMPGQGSGGIPGGGMPDAGSTDAGNAGQSANDAGAPAAQGTETPAESGTPAEAADTSNGAQQAGTSNPNAGNVDAGNVGQTPNDAGNMPETPTRSGLQRAASALRTAGDMAQKAGSAGSATHSTLSGIGEKIQELAEPLDASHNAAAVSIKLHD